MPVDLDVLIIGSGVAGLTAAVRAAMAQPGLSIGVLTKSALETSSTRWAQGGIAAVLPGGGDGDSTDLHCADTLAAGAGLCDPDAVRALVDEGPARVQDLIALGAEFDRQAGGSLSRVREGGHSNARVIHAGGAATGLEIERALVDAVRRTAVALYEGWFALDVVVEGGECQGVVALDASGTTHEIRASNVVIAAGGAGQLFAVTTNPPEATGDGIAMALRAGVMVADVEFMQFHPTALHHPAMPRPLLSEALRGHGALLRDLDGERFVDELSPRDVVCRAMQARMVVLGASHLWLDATGLEDFATRFPTIAASLARAGLDPSTDWLPVAPAAHYLSGGILTDLDGASSLPGLWACGESACTGVHGANRLASNSLLEGMVFGARVVDAIEGGRRGPTMTGALRGPFHRVDRGLPVDNGPNAAKGRSRGQRLFASSQAVFDSEKVRSRLQSAMTEDAGVVRDATSLAHAAGVVDEVAHDLPGVSGHRYAELRNLVSCARALIASAQLRTESRGAHWRRDHPDPDAAWGLRIVHGEIAA